MPKRKTRTGVSLDCEMIEIENQNVNEIENNRVVDGASNSRLRRRLLCLNRNNDDSINILSNTVKSSTNQASFFRTGLMYVKKHLNGESSSNCCETKIKYKRGNNVHSTQFTHKIVEATKTQHNCNVANNSIPHTLENYPKDKSQCNMAADNGSSTDQVNTIAPTEQLNNIGDSSSSVCDSHEVKLPDIRLSCGDGQLNLPCKELDCVGEPEPLLCTQDLVLEPTQNSNDQSEIQWDCQSVELVREVKQMQGQYGIDEIRKIVSNFSDTNVELQQKHIIPELKLYSPVMRNSALARKHQKAKDRAGIRLQQKAYGRESAEEILKWLQKKASEQLPGGHIEKTVTLETLESQQGCSYMTPSLSPVLDGDFNGNIPDNAFQIPLEEDETSVCQSNNIAASAAAVSSVTYTQALDLSKQNTIVFKILNACQKQKVDIPDGVFEKLQEIDEVLDEQASTISTSASAPPKSTAFVEAALTLLHVQSDVTPSVSATEDDAFDVNFSDDDFHQPLEVDDTFNSENPHSTSVSAPPKKTSAEEVALKSLHIQSTMTWSVSATEDDAFDVSFPDDDTQLLLATDQTLDSQASTIATSASAPPEKTVAEKAVWNSIHVQSATTSSVSATDDGAFDVSFSDHDFHQLLEVDETLDSQAHTVSTSKCMAFKTLKTQHEQSGMILDVLASPDDFNVSISDNDCHMLLEASVPSKNTVSMGAVLNSLHVQSVMASSVSAIEDDAFDVSFSDDDFHQPLEVEVTLESQNHHSTSVSAPPKKTSAEEVALKSLHVQSATTLSVSATEDDAFNVSFTDDDFHQPLEVDDTFDSENPHSTSVSAPPKKTSAEEVALKSLHVQSATTLSVSATEDDAFDVSFTDDDFHQPLEVDDNLDSQKHHSTSVSALPKKTSAEEVAVKSLHVQSAMTSSVSATEDDAFDVSFCDDDFHQPLEVDEISENLVSTISTSKSMAVDTQKSLKIQSDMTLGISASCDHFRVRISDDECHMLLEDDESFVYEAGSILTSKAGPSKETAAVVAKSNPLYVQPRMAASVSTKEDNVFNVGIPDDDWLFEVGETLDRHGYSVSSSETGLLENTAAVCGMTHQVLSDVIENVSREPDDYDDVSDSQFLLEVNEIWDKPADIISASATNCLNEKTVAVATSFKTLRIQSYKIQNVSMIHDEFTVIPDDVFEQLLEVDEVMGSQTNILSASTAADLLEKTAEVTTFKTLQAQSDLIQSISMTQEFDIPDDDFEQKLEVDEALGSQTNILSASTAADLPVEVLQIQSDVIQSIPITPHKDAHFPDDDFEYLLEVDEGLGSQTNILSSSTAADLPEKTGEVETLKTLQIQSDMKQSISMAQEFNILDDDFEHLLEVDDNLSSQTNILSPTPADLYEKTAEVETFETLQVQSDFIQSISLTPDDAHFPDDDFEHLLEVNKTLGSQGNNLSTAAAVGAGVTHRPASGLHNEITSCKMFDAGQIQRPSTHNNDAVIKKLLEMDETLHNQAGSISTSVTTGPGVTITPESDHLETSPKASQMQPSVSMNISKLTNITNGIANHDAFTSDSKQLSLSKLTEYLSSSSSSRAVNNSPANVNSPRRFKFQRIASLQMNSDPHVSKHSSFIPHVSSLNTSATCSSSSSLSSNEVMLNPANTSKWNQVGCSLEEIEQKRQAALQKRSLRLGQLKDAVA